MDTNNFKYDVFISYRQLETDKSVAARLHNLLEIYRTPRPLVRRGVARRLGRVFRDTDELAASSSLSDSIRSALEDSRFLVVVCSPRTPESCWVSEEIAIFHELGRGNQILPLLIEGEPADSLPPALSTATAGLPEPLAADIRASTLSRSLRRLRREKLRIIAPILGVDFAELEQRESKRLRFRVATSLGIGLAIAMTGFGIWYQGQRSTLAQAEIAEAQARTALSISLSDLSNAQLEKDLSLSLLLSVEANRNVPTVQSRGSLLEGLSRASGAWTILRAHGNSVSSLAFNPGGDRLVSAAYDGKLITWNLQTRQVHRLLSEESRMHARAITFTSVSSVMASARSSEYGAAKIALWDTQSWNLMSEHSLGFSSQVDALAFDQTGSKLFALTADGLISLWAVPGLKPLNNDSGAYGRFLLNDRQGGVISLLKNGALSIWKSEEFESEDALGHALSEGEYGSIWSAALAPSGDRLALGPFSCKASEHTTGKNTSCVRVWRLSTQDFTGGPIGEDTIPHDFMAFNSDETLLATAQRGRSVVSLWNLENGSARTLDIADGAVTSLAFSPVKYTLAVGTSAGTIELWEEPGWPTLGRRINKPGEAGWGASISPDAKLLAAGGRNATIVLWDLVDNHMIHEAFSGHEKSLRSVAFSRNGKRMVSVGADGVIVFRNAVDAKPLGSPIDTGTTVVTAIALNVDGSKIAWWDGSYEELNILDLATGEGTIAVLPNNSGLRAVRLQFVDQDRKILIATRDCRMLEWDSQSKSLRTLVNIKPLEGCTRVATDAELGLVAFGMQDGTIELWDSASRRRLGTLTQGHRDMVRTLAFSNGHETLVSGDGTDIVLWDLDLSSWMMRACEIANRNFSEAEWRLYFHAEPYRETCGPWGAFIPPNALEPSRIETKPIRPSELQ